MAKSNKQRAGLQKKVSSVFRGVSVPGERGAGQSPRKKVPDRDAVSAKTKPDENQPQSGPKTDKAPQPEVLEGQTNRQSKAAAAESSTSTDVKKSKKRSVKKPAPSEESQGPVILEPAAMYAPDISEEPKTAQKPATKESDPVDEPAAMCAPDVSDEPKTARKPATKKSDPVDEPAVMYAPDIADEPKTVRKPATKESDSVDEPAAMYAPDISEEPKTAQKPATKKSDPVDKPAAKKAPKKKAGPEPRVSKSQPAEPSSLMRKLAQAEESGDADVGSPSDSTGPVLVKSLADQTAPEKAKESTPTVSPPRQKAQSPLAKKLAQSEEAESDSPSKLTATAAASKAASRQTSEKSPKRKDVRQGQAPPARTAPAKHPLADQLADAVDEGGFLEQIREKLMPSEGGSAKDKVMVMLVPVLAIVMVFVFRQVLHKSPGKTQGADKKGETVIAAANPSDEILWTIPEPLPAMTRDPLKLPGSDKPENPDETGTENPGQGTTAGQGQTNFLKVRAIVRSDDKATALVGNQIVRAGGTINGVTIVKINKDSVELERNGETWIQKVHD